MLRGLVVDVFRSQTDWQTKSSGKMDVMTDTVMDMRKVKLAIGGVQIAMLMTLAGAVTRGTLTMDFQTG